MEHTIEWYQGLMDELDEEFDETIVMFDAIDQMVRPEWSLPGDFTAVIKDVMAVVDTAPSDAINSGAIALSRTTPIPSVTPFAANRMEYDRAQKIEEALKFHFKKSNTRGNGTVMYDIADSSLRYNTICGRTDDLAHIFPKDPAKWTPLQKAAWRNGRFIDEIKHPRNMRYTFSSLGLTLVGYKDTMRIGDVINHWSLYKGNKTEEGKRIAQTLEDLQKEVGEFQKKNPSYTLKDMFFTQVYAIDYDKLCVWGSLTNRNGEDLALSVPSDFIWADQANPYGFIPWTVRVAGSRLDSQMEYRVNPLLAPLYWSGSWDKLNLAKSIIFSEPIRRARNPRGISVTTSGESPNVDYENGNEINLRTGEDYKPFQALTLDPNALAVVGQLEAAMNRTTGASMIGDTTKISSNTPFSTFSAMVKVALSRLDKQNVIMQDSVADMLCHRLAWVQKTGIPLQAFMEGDSQFRSGTVMKRGTMMEVGSGDFDLNYPGISVKIRPATPTDQMELINMAVILSTKLNQPVSQLMQDLLGYENVGLSYELWTQEFLKTAELQAQAQAMVAEATGMAQAKVQQAMQAGAQGPQGAPQPAGGGGGQPMPGNAPMGAGGGISETSFAALGGQEGVNPAIGGMSPTRGAPSMTREAVTGKNRMQR
jgi:hypothetical protein